MIHSRRWRLALPFILAALLVFATAPGTFYPPHTLTPRVVEEFWGNNDSAVIAGEIDGTACFTFADPQTAAISAGDCSLLPANQGGGWRFPFTDAIHIYGCDVYLANNTTDSAVGWDANDVIPCQFQSMEFSGATGPTDVGDAFLIRSDAYGGTCTTNCGMAENRVYWWEIAETVVAAEGALQIQIDNDGTVAAADAGNDITALRVTFRCFFQQL